MTPPTKTTKTPPTTSPITTVMISVSLSRPIDKL